MAPSRTAAKRNLMARLKRLLVLLAALTSTLAALSVPSQQALGQQTGMPSTDQIEMFRNLTPDQQDAILKQLGGGATGGSMGGSLGGGATGSLTGDRQGTQSDRTRQETEQERADRMDREDLQPLIPLFKPDDWTIVEIDFHLAPRAISSPLQALYSGQSTLSPQSAQAMQLAGAAGAPMQPAGMSNPASAAQQPAPAASDNLPDEEKKRLQDLMDMIRSKNPYRLTPEGVLNLPGFAGIAVLGLTEDQASLRLKVEPAFRNVDIRLTRLPLKKTGAEGLKSFGYDLFDRAPSTFAPVTNVPVPSDYTVGTGDMLEVQLFGNQNRTLKLVVGRDGRVSFPELGPISVAGLLFSEVKSRIEARIAAQLIGVHGNVSMGDLRSIRVFVLGEAKHPGSYTISGLGTITSALFAAGGVRPVGSLRKIELKRQGTLIRQLDLYDMLIRGDTTDDAKLQQGDVVFIPPVGKAVGIAGEVRRSAIYEIKNESTIADVVELAGGLTPSADTSNAMLTRIDETQHRVVIPVDLSSDGAKTQAVRNGDLVRVSRLRPTLDSGIVVQGHVYTPGDFAYRPGIRLTDVIHSVDDLKSNADLHYIFIRRELPPNRRITVVSADLAAALFAPGSSANIELQPRDQITVFDFASGRERVIQPVLDELRLQSNSATPTELVHVDGRVKVPGDYPLETGMTVTDLVRAGGGLADAAYGSKAELTRYKIVNGEMRSTEVINVDVAAALRGDAAGNLRLEPFDNLSIKEVQEWGTQAGVELAGEVRFPGRYAIKRGETLKSVITRAGGLADFAFPEGSVFTRRELKVREQEQLDMLSERMQRDLALLALQSAAANQGGAGAALSVGQSLLGQLRSAKAVGRLVIDLPRALHDPVGSPRDVILRDGDRLIVPKFQQQVTVIGEVQNSTSHLFSADLSRDDYIGLSGGMTRNADHRRIYVVHANGSVVANEGNRWFERTSGEIKPGDTIVVPLDATKMPALPLWTAVTQIIYNVAIAVAAVRSF
jgi:protein involved in polysaccharide export with SLBB domain